MSHWKTEYLSKIKGLRSVSYRNYWEKMVKNMLKHAMFYRYSGKID